MQFRDHPIFDRTTFNWWPPAWTRVGYDNTEESIHGEVGILDQVNYHDRLPDRLFLRMHHDNGLYTGALVVNNEALCLQLCKLLEKHLGRTIKEIGDLEIDFLL